jgi:hypothetical protein
MERPILSQSGGQRQKSFDEDLENKSAGGNKPVQAEAVTETLETSQDKLITDKPPEPLTSPVRSPFIKRGSRFDLEPSAPTQVTEDTPVAQNTSGESLKRQVTVRQVAAPQNQGDASAKRVKPKKVFSLKKSPKHWTKNILHRVTSRKPNT